MVKMERKWSRTSDTLTESCISQFLQKFESLNKKLKCKKQKLVDEIEVPSAKEHERKFSFCERNPLSRNELESIYMEAIYTIKHKIGKTIDGHSEYANDLYTYVQEAFKLDNCERLLSKMDEEKPPIIFLNVEIVEARNLEAKDANGFSDPYCMLGIIPGTSFFTTEKFSSGSEDETVRSLKNKNRADVSSSFLRRLSSFGRSRKGSNRSSKKSISSQSGAIRDGKLPAKYIQTTDVKKETLNPVWMQKFRFKIDDLDKDMLHLDIWDHDDEFSVVEAARKLNEVKSLKGLDRYFKQIAQSARTDKSDKNSHVDDFLGSVNIGLRTIPSNGIDQWYDLEGRTEKSNVEGKIRIKLSLATREDRGSTVFVDECNYSELNEHEKLMQIFIDCDLARYRGKSEDWNGELSMEAETILHQHAIQGDMTDIQIWMCRWIAYSRKQTEKQLSYKLLLDILHKLNSIWKPTSISRDELETLRESFVSKYFFNSMKKIREKYPVSSKESLQKLEYVLTLINEIYRSEIFKYCCPFQNSATHELTQIIKATTLGFFDQLVAIHVDTGNDDDGIVNLANLTRILILELYKSANYYNSIFERTVALPYFNIVYKLIDQKLFEFIAKVFNDEFGNELHDIVPIEKHLDHLHLACDDNSTTKKDLAPDYCLLNEHSALSLYELYFMLQEFTRLATTIDENDRMSLKTLNFYQLFNFAMSRWIEIIGHKMEKKINQFINNIDKVEINADDKRLADSSSELNQLLKNVSNIWKAIAWPDEFGSLYFASKLHKKLAKTCSKYSTHIFEITKNAQTAYLKTHNPNTVGYANNRSLDYQIIMKKCCIAVNVIEQIIASVNSLQIPQQNPKKEMETVESISSSSKAVSTLPMAQEVVYIENIIEWILKSHIEVEIEPHLFYYFESPESAPAIESISRLIQYLDTNLVIFSDEMHKSNFRILLKVLWIKLLYRVKELIKTDNTRTIMFFYKLNNTLDILIDFLNAENEGLSKDVLVAFDAYVYLKSFLNYAQIETKKLLHMYYENMVKIQKSVESNEFGLLVCKAFYQKKHEILCIEVIKCKDLQPMDQNGLSDPFVEVELKPYHQFAMIEKKTTAIVKKCLNPKFNETFEFKVPEKLFRTPGAVVNFTVMDHDLMWTNDFEGEAFIELNSIPELGTEVGDEGYKNIVCMELPLIQPKRFPNVIWEILETRTYDKIAVDFVKRRNYKMKA